MKKPIFGIVAALATVLLAGCSLNDLKQHTELQSAPVTYNQGEFNRESLYDLLVAEIAGQQRDFDLAMDMYLKQARLTKDAGVAERATRVAQYLRNVEAISEAATLWRQAAPENPEPYQISASILLHQKQYAQALPLIERAFQYDRARILAVIRSQISSMPADVVEGYLNVISTLLNGDLQTDLLVTQALLYNQQGNLELALSSLNEALQVDPKSTDAIANKAELLRANGQFKEALDTLAPAMSGPVNEQKLQILYTQLLFQSKQPDAGVKEAKAMLRQYNKDYQLKFYLALVMLENDRVKDAKPLFEELLEQGPADTRPHFYLGVIAQDEGNNEKAIEHFMEVDDASTIYQAISRISVLLDKSEDKARLQQIITDVRNTRPDMAAQLYGLEAEWLQLHDYEDEALVLLEDALSRFNDNVNLLYTRAMLQESTDFPKAEKDLRRILAVEPENSLALNALGYTLTVHTDRYDEALDLISRALKVRPDDPAIIDSMGWVLFKLQRYTESIQYLEKAFAAINDPEVASHLIQAYWANGNKEKALKLLREGLAKDPDSTHLQEAARAVEAY